MESTPQPSDSSSEKLTTFSYFPELPTELRLKIWDLCIPAARDVYLSPKADRRIQKHPPFRGWFITSASFIVGGLEFDTNCIPPLLHVNQESQEVGLASYELAFESCHRAGTAYIDFERDTLKMTRAGANCLGMFLGGAFWGADGAEKIRNLEFRVETHMWDVVDFCWNDVRQFSSLRNLRLMIYASFVDDSDIPGIREKLRNFALRHPEWKVPNIRIWLGSPSMRHWVTLEDLNITENVLE
ncbi:hypothetical protein SBOR_1737 [Sclerotinia borealis F-4128]|uniref:2EXR domain-containing protein n=1 Tax=Sclerotinia borealis (strain F-4128) TaxID=1432307 RepID=W9CPV5_SCLBF|nr:hypothetical protein SBOR_1737 [Sclerotinia borealis F-4128]